MIVYVQQLFKLFKQCDTERCCLKGHKMLYRFRHSMIPFLRIATLAPKTNPSNTKPGFIGWYLWVFTFLVLCFLYVTFLHCLEPFRQKGAKKNSISVWVKIYKDI